MSDLPLLQILAARRIERLTEIKSDLEARYGVHVTVGALDLSDPTSSDAFYDSLPSELRENVDVLVNNAGMSTFPATVVDTDWSEITSIIDVNVKGVVKMIKLFVPSMLKRGTGHIINISSLAGKDSIPHIGVYAGTKHMLEAINTSLRAELVATPLRVSLVSPGFTRSELTTAMFKGDAQMGASVFVGFQPLESEDIADSIVYVASRPEHVQVVDLMVAPSAQASVHLLHRETPLKE